VTAELGDCGPGCRVRERLSGLTESVHGLELQMHEKRLHVTSLLERVLRVALDENILVAEYGPDQLVPAASEGEEPRRRPAAQRRRLQDAERKLVAAGRVNPLALEEFAALEQRHAFLTEQLADLVQTRSDLETIIGELDERMQTIFLAAFEDTKTVRRGVPDPVPGGSGSISLTDPTTRSRPASRSRCARRQEDRAASLLSGGERPRGGRAADGDLQGASEPVLHPRRGRGGSTMPTSRLLGVFEQLRASSQLIVITHQKRTMEIADALYGVSMRQDGVSAVVGQRSASAKRSERTPGIRSRRTPCRWRYGRMKRSLVRLASMRACARRDDAHGCLAASIPDTSRPHRHRERACNRALERR
jgi:chromosome segregation protein